MAVFRWAIRIDTKYAAGVECRLSNEERSAPVSRTKLGRGQFPPSSIDMEKMLRFSRWWFADESKQVARDENRREDDESDRRSAA